MQNRGRLVKVFILVLWGAAIFSSCGDDDDVQNSDTGTQEDADLNDDTADLLEDTESPDAVTDPEPDEGDADDPGEEEELGGCAEAAGGYLLSGECNTSLVSLPPLACVLQDGCTIELVSAMLAFEGSIEEHTFEISNEIPPYTQDCEGTEEEGGSWSLECAGVDLPWTCSGTATPLDLEDVSSTCCDPIAQDCPTPTDHCGLLGVSEATGFITACFPATGEQGLDEPCERESAAFTDIGRDNCAPGLMCVNYDSASPSERYCRAYCTSVDDCGEGQGCRRFEGSVPPLGLCGVSCVPTGDSSECVEGSYCTLLYDYSMEDGRSLVSGYCAFRGTVEEGQRCSYANDCVPGLKCEYSAAAGQAVCLRMCDTDHPCTGEEETCVTVDQLVPSLEVGTCQ